MHKSLDKGYYDNGKHQLEKENGDEKQITYVFEFHEDTMSKDVDRKISTGVWQILPSACASLTCIPFGMMLGWPSPTYPTLLSEDSPLPISLDQSAMIAGFLMLGVSFGTIFSTKYVGTGPKYGIIFGTVLILAGWIIMWQARNIYFLLASRFILGTGYGYATGQVKCYILEITEEELSAILIKQLYFYGMFGFLSAFCIGPFVKFREYSFISLVVSAFVLFLGIFLPPTPRELLRADKIKDARKLLLFLKPDLNVNQEIDNIVQKMSEPPKSQGFVKIMRNKVLRTNFIKLSILLIFQQYCGAPATMVYTQILFTKSNVPYSQFAAIFYAVLFLIASIIGTYISPKFNKKAVLLISSCTVCLTYVSKIFVIYFRVNETYFSYASVIVMYVFIVVYTVGLGSIPFTMINDLFPSNFRQFVTKYFIIMSSLLALTITKIFQVLIGMFPMYVPFCLFTGIIIVAVLFIAVFIPSDLSLMKINEKSIK